MSKNTNSYIYKEAQNFSLEDVLESYLDENDSIEFFETDGSDIESDHVDYDEEESESEEVITVEEALSPMVEGEESLGEVGQELIDMDEDLTKFIEEHGDEKISIIPGSEAKESDFEEKEEDEDEGDYVNDGNIKKFIDYINEIYPSKIPKHDGKTTLGCERAKSWLEKLDKEISVVIRKDQDGLLDINALENIRTNIMTDVAKLSKHINVLKNRFKEENKKKASVDENGIPSWTNASGDQVEYSSLRKEAATPNKMVISVTPFERAISGIMINAHVSAGHSMEEVYDFLSKKYEITPREELAIMQVCMDSGFHIFKDRGTYSGSSKESDKKEKNGVDFIKNYFA